MPFESNPYSSIGTFFSAVLTRTLEFKLKLVNLPVQLAKKELEGALSVDGVEATLLRVRLQIVVSCGFLVSEC